MVSLDLCPYVSRGQIMTRQAWEEFHTKAIAKEGAALERIIGVIDWIFAGFRRQDTSVIDDCFYREVIRDVPVGGFALAHKLKGYLESKASQEGLTGLELANNFYVNSASMILEGLRLVRAGRDYMDLPDRQRELVSGFVATLKFPPHD